MTYHVQGSKDTAICHQPSQNDMRLVACGLQTYSISMTLIWALKFCGIFP